MAAPQDSYRFAWALEIQQTPPVYAATTDLPEDAAVTTLGNHVYTKRLKDIDTALHSELSGVFYGVGTVSAATFVLDNSDGALDPNAEWRLKIAILYHYDRTLNVAVQDFTGVVTAVEFLGTEAHVTVGSQNDALWEEFLPMAVINPVVGSPMELTASPGVPVPVVFGDFVPVRPPSLAADIQSDPDGFDYAVGYDVLYINGVFLDTNSDPRDLERLGEWIQAPGSPVFVSATRFSVTGNQSERYLYGSGASGIGGMPIRFRTGASGANYLYSTVASYDTTTTPHQVVLADALLATGLALVQLDGDFMIIRSGYANITVGLLPQPGAPGANLTAVRLWATEDGNLVVRASNPNWPNTGGTAKHISEVIAEILTNATWGLSTRTAQAIDTTSFNAAKVLLGLANLTGAVAGALGYDQQQRRAADVLGELLILRGGRLGMNASGQHTIAFDQTPPATTKVFRLGSGDASAIPIKRITARARRPLDQTVRNVVLHWQCLGRTSSTTKFTAREYARQSTAPVMTIGQDLHLFNQWIRDATIAARVAFYIAEKLKGADETLELVAGVEARDVTLGETITVQVPSDGINADYQVYAITKTLTQVTLATYKSNPNAYNTTITGVISTDDPVSTEQRTTPDPGANLVPNPDFSPPPITPTFMVPHGWGTIPPPAASGLTTGSASYSQPGMDYSAGSLPFTFGGHTYRLTFTGTNATPLAGGDGIFTDPFSVRANVRDQCLLSVYCSQAEGIYFVVEELPSHTVKRVKVVYDSTDANGLGWGRYYGRTSLRTDTTRLVWGICVNKDGTYEWDAADCRLLGRSARRPPVWARARPTPVTLTAGATLTLNGGATFTATNLIPGGAYVRGVTVRVLTGFTMSGTGYNIGLAANDSAWGSNINKTAVGDTTNSSDFTVTNSTFFATATSVIVTGFAGSTLGTVGSPGSIRVQVEYTYASPAAGP